jgi:hypothetical protein
MDVSDILRISRGSKTFGVQTLQLEGWIYRIFRPSQLSLDIRHSNGSRHSAASGAIASYLRGNMDLVEGQILVSLPSYLANPCLLDDKFGKCSYQ